MEVDITEHLTFSKLHKAIVVFENIGEWWLICFLSDFCHDDQANLRFSLNSFPWTNEVIQY